MPHVELCHKIRAVERRQTVDRRRFPRGGRRPGDVQGLSPLVLIVEPHATLRALTDVELTIRHFAVAAVDSVDGALTACRDAMPAVILCNHAYASRLRDRLGPVNRVAIVSNTSDEGAPAVIERIRRALGGSVRS